MKGSIIPLKQFSILDDDLEQQSVKKIYVRTSDEFYGYFQAWWDLLNDCVFFDRLIPLAHLLNIYKENIYICELIPDGNRYKIGNIIRDRDDEWSVTNHIKQIIDNYSNKLISNDFKWDAHSGIIYKHNIITQIAGLDHMEYASKLIYNIMSPHIYSNSYLIKEFAVGKYRANPNYLNYKDMIIELLNNEMDP